ncbi:biotin--[acetyl-CoA-carboxylase] ligase [Martelella sp. HB161492]|uniref:biotin--[acetyl-CoA-carboxylase] ligase n=1 Tax=Martelella sp. HB161492 TaxID=2720726 RepID=UPI001FEE3ACF|nr:biotin--[acetyl-CoA-carboxylase] ligase [Martelella sp. HB161492]
MPAFGAMRHEALDEVDSTNSEAMRRAKAGDPGGLWITAARQTGGRGRRGRRWVSERGNLYASLLLINPARSEDIASLPLAVALAVRQAVAAAAPGISRPVEIKWPNDVLIARNKIAGILLEAEQLPDGRNAIVIGIGVNVGFAPEVSAYPTARLRDYAPGADPEMLFAHLFAAMDVELTVWNGGKGIRETVESWRRHACGIGEPITVNLLHDRVSGRFAGIDDSGMLMLETQEGMRVFAAGDVFFGT